MRVLSHENKPRCVAYSPDGSLLACGDETGITLYSLPDAAEVGRVRVEERGAKSGQSVEALAFSPNGKQIVAGCVHDIAVLEVASQTLTAGTAGHESGTRALAWSPDGREIVSAGWDRTLRFWTPGLSQARENVPTPEPLTSLAFNHTGDTLAGGGSHRSLLFFTIEPGRTQWTQAQANEAIHPVYSLAATRTGLLASGHADGRIVLWDFAKRQSVGELHSEWVVYGLAFTPDGTRLVSGGADGNVRLWDVPHRRLIETYRWHKSWVTCVAVSPDGMTAAAGGDDYDMVLWDLADV